MKPLRFEKKYLEAKGRVDEPDIGFLLVACSDAMAQVKEANPNYTEQAAYVVAAYHFGKARAKI